MTHRKPGYIAGVVMGLFLLPGCATLATETGSLEAVPAVAQTTDAAPPSTIDPSPTAVLAADIGSDAATDTDTPTTVVVGKHSAQEVADMLVIEEVTPFPDADPAKTSGSGDIWDRVRKGFALPDQYDNHPLVVNHLQWHLCRPDFLQRVTARAEPFLHFIMEEIDARGMPSELVLLPVVESAYLPFAYSSGRAAGIWQFIPSTGRHFGLKQTWWYDGRRDVYAATHAALDYLQSLHRRFDGDWLLALAAYNAGQGTVGRAIARNEQAGRPTDFWNLDLPPETRNYVPKLLALKALVENPEHYFIELWPVSDEPYLALVELDDQIDLSLAADVARIDLEELYMLNPGYNRWATDPAGPHRLLLPIERADGFVASLNRVPADRRMTWDRHLVRSGDTLIGIARQHGITVAQLQEINKLRGSGIRAGQHLLVPRGGRTGGTTLAAASQTGSAGRDSAHATRKTHVVKPGESLWRIARDYDLTVADLTRWNGKNGNDTLRPGDKLVVWLPAKTSATATRVATAPDVRPQGRVQTVSYSVRNGDSLYSISRRFSVAVADIRRWNRVEGDLLRPGQRLTLYVDPTRGI